jgi:hypothetical protein
MDDIGHIRPVANPENNQDLAPWNALSLRASRARQGSD